MYTDNYQETTDKILAFISKTDENKQEKLNDLLDSSINCNSLVNTGFSETTSQES